MINISTIYEDYVCQNCYNTEIIRCDNCGELFYYMDCDYNEDENMYLCRFCKEDNELWQEVQKQSRE